MPTGMKKNMMSVLSNRIAEMHTNRFVDKEGLSQEYERIIKRLFNMYSDIYSGA